MPESQRLRARARARAIELESRISQTQRFHRYRFACHEYIQTILGGHIWPGIDGHDGLMEICQAINLVMRQLDERARLDAGQITAEEARLTRPGQVIKNHIRVEGCHSSGKTWLFGGGIANWFFDSWGPCIVETFAPSAEAVNDLLWKELRAARNAAGLAPRPQDVPRLKAAEKWFARGRSTNDAGGQGRERIQGQHADRMLFIYDEAEGIPEFVWKATDTMQAGGMVLIVSMANPRTKSSTFHRMRSRPNVWNFRLSGLYHPNVYYGRTIIPGGAISREWVNHKIREHCRRVDRHDPDLDTFEAPWDPGKIYQPDADFRYQVLAVPPSDGGGDVFVPAGRYEAAVARGHRVQELGVEAVLGKVPEDALTRATAGIDPARYGDDPATLYCCWAECLWRQASWDRSDSIPIVNAVVALGRDLAQRGVTVFHVRVDAGGGYGSGIVDILRRHQEVIDLFEEFEVLEINNEGTSDLTSDDAERFKDVGAMLYATAGERLLRVAVLDPPERLEVDLTERRWLSALARGRWVKRLQSKDDVRKHRWSPNDGDGAVLALAPIEVLQPKKIQATPIAF